MFPKKISNCYSKEFFCFVIFVSSCAYFVVCSSPDHFYCNRFCKVCSDYVVAVVLNENEFKSKVQNAGLSEEAMLVHYYYFDNLLWLTKKLQLINSFTYNRDYFAFCCLQLVLRAEHFHHMCENTTVIWSVCFGLWCSAFTTTGCG